MDTEHELAFLRGIRKCALEKEAFIGALAGGAMRTLAPLIISNKILGKAQAVLPRFMKRPGLVGRGATAVNTALESNGLANTAVHMGTHMALSPVIDPAVGYVANKFDGQGY
jgi:hypothetical protein